MNERTMDVKYPRIAIIAWMGDPAAHIQSLVREREFSLYNFFAGLHEFGFCFDAQPSSVLKQLIHRLVGDLPVEQFADTRLWFTEDDLKFLLRVLFRVLQYGAIQLGLEL